MNNNIKHLSVYLNTKCKNTLYNALYILYVSNYLMLVYLVSVYVYVVLVV